MCKNDAADYVENSVAEGAEENPPMCKPKSGDKQDEVVMESGGVTPESSPAYTEADDVENSITEGYF